MTGHFYERLYVATDGICQDVPGSRRLKNCVNEVQCNEAKMYSLLLLRFALPRSIRVRGDFIAITSRRSAYVCICDLFQASLACTARIYA